MDTYEAIYQPRSIVNHPEVWNLRWPKAAAIEAGLEALEREYYGESQKGIQWKTTNAAEK
jgi:hypothetical protein